MEYSTADLIRLYGMLVIRPVLYYAVEVTGGMGRTVGQALETLRPLSVLSAVAQSAHGQFLEEIGTNDMGFEVTPDVVNAVVSAIAELLSPQMDFVNLAAWLEIPGNVQTLADKVADLYASYPETHPDRAAEAH